MTSSPFSAFQKQMESTAHDECTRANQRVIPSPHEDAGHLPSQDAVLLLLFGLLRSGQVKMRHRRLARDGARETGGVNVRWRSEAG